MARKKRELAPATVSHRYCARAAVENLRTARDQLKAAGCPRAAKAVARALASAEGALRHLERRLEHAKVETEPGHCGRWLYW